MSLSLDLSLSSSIYEKILKANRSDDCLQFIKKACKRNDKRFNLIKLNDVRINKNVLYRDRRL